MTAVTVANARPAGRDAEGARRAVRRVPGAAWLALLAPLMVAVAPLLLMSETSDSPARSSAWPWALAVTTVAGFRYSWLVARGAARLFELVFWLFAYVFLGLAPLVQMRTGVYPGTTPGIDTSLNGKAMAVVLVGIGAFILGTRLSRGYPAKVQPLETVVRPHRLLAMTAVAVLMAAYYVSGVGAHTLFTTRAQRSAAEAAHWPDPAMAAVVRAAATWPLLVCFVGLLVLRRQRRARGARGPQVLPVVVLALLGIVVNPLTTARYVFGTAVLAVAVALGVTRAGRFRLFAAALAVGMVLVFPYADIARYAGQHGSGKTGGPVSVLSSPDFDAPDQVNNALAYVDVNGHTQGRQLAGAALFFVPRKAWPNKPEDTGILLAEFRNYKVTNLSAPLWAEFFIDGGWVLLALGMAAVGWLARHGDDWALAGGHSARGLLPVICPFYGILVLRGSLLQAMAGLAVIVVCALFIGRRERVRA